LSPVSNTKKEGASGQAANSSSSGTASKPETKPVGSANALDTTADDGDGFWMVVEGVTHAQVISAEPNTLFDELEEVAHAHAVGGLSHEDILEAFKVLE
jgi:hypothetical protein